MFTFRRLKSLLLLLLVACFTAVAFVGCLPKATADSYTIADSVKIGVISDTQTPGNGNIDGQMTRYRQALITMRERKINVLIFAGDVTDVKTKDAYKTFSTIYDEVFTDKKTAPVKSFILGNHDYWLPNFGFGEGKTLEIPNGAAAANRFKKYLGESPWSHKIVNGYHFIALSPTSGKYTKAYNSKIKWAEKAIQQAVKEDPTKPIFVTTHQGAINVLDNPLDNNNLYGAEYGDPQLTELFNKYPQVVNFSGHTHYSLLNERSIHQDKFTSIGTGSISYTDFEAGKEMDISQQERECMPIGMVVEVSNDKMDILRIATDTNKEVKADNRWSISLPINKDTFNYTNARATASVAPEFDKSSVGSIEMVEKNIGGTLATRKHLVFDTPTHKDLVTQYKVVVKDTDGKTLKFDDKDYLLYFSNYYQGKVGQKESLGILRELPSGCTFYVYASDCFSNFSSTPLIIS